MPWALGESLTCSAVASTLPVSVIEPTMEVAGWGDLPAFDPSLRFWVEVCASGIGPEPAISTCRISISKRGSTRHERGTITSRVQGNARQS
ncbi:MAG: hypothetical protein MUF84_19490 [Anaerolineae bacterium]|nr:hypothetical protein [Anaerolineae bacterium]